MQCKGRGSPLCWGSRKPTASASEWHWTEAVPLIVGNSSVSSLALCRTVPLWEPPKWHLNCAPNPIGALSDTSRGHNQFRDRGLPWSNFQSHTFCLPGSLSFHSEPSFTTLSHCGYPDGEDYWATLCSLRLPSTDVRVNPIVRFNYFSNPGDVCGAVCEWHLQDRWCTEEPFHGGFPIQGMVCLGAEIEDTWGLHCPLNNQMIGWWESFARSEYYMALPWWMPCGQGSWSQFQGYWDWCFPSCWWFDIHCITRDQCPVPSFDAWTVSVFLVIWMLQSFCWFVRVDYLPCCAKRNYKRTLLRIC